MCDYEKYIAEYEENEKLEQDRERIKTGMQSYQGFRGFNLCINDAFCENLNDINAECVNTYLDENPVYNNYFLDGIKYAFDFIRTKNGR